jgi:hypothetical protein
VFALEILVAGGGVGWGMRWMRPGRLRLGPMAATAWHTRPFMPCMVGEMPAALSVAGACLATACAADADTPAVVLTRHRRVGQFCEMGDCA